MSKTFRKLKLEELNRISPDEYENSEKIPLVIILDNIRSLNNIGSFFRTADAFRIKEIWLCGFTAKPPHREINKTALGSTETVSWKYFEKIKDAVEEAKRSSFTLIAVEQSENSTSLSEFDHSIYKNVALIFGNEVEGVSEEFMSQVKEVIEIPQEGTKHSLNVSVSAGILMWEFFKHSTKQKL